MLGAPATRARTGGDDRAEHSSEIPHCSPIGYANDAQWLSVTRDNG